MEHIHHANARFGRATPDCLPGEGACAGMEAGAVFDFAA